MGIDPLLEKFKPDDLLSIYSLRSHFEEEVLRTSYADHYLDECFAVAGGVKTMAHADLAGRLAVDTAIWGYKLIRQRKYYWQDKKLLLKRIFRSVNIAIWQKHRETGFEAGIAASMLVVIFGPKTSWIGWVGNIRGYFFRNNSLLFKTTDDVDESGKVNKSVGPVRFGLIPHMYTSQLESSDTLLIVPESVWKYVSDSELTRYATQEARSNNDLDEISDKIIQTAIKVGGKDDMTVCLVKRK